MNDLPVLLSPNGEPVTLTTAEHLLRAAGIEDAQAADTEQLAAFLDGMKHWTALTREAQGVVNDELVSRLDKRGRWSLEVDGLKVTAPSPDAGTVAYDPLALELALSSLVAEGTIDAVAWRGAVEWVDPEPYLKVKQAGVKALLKLPAAREAIEACRVDVEPPPRKVKVSRV